MFRHAKPLYLSFDGAARAGAVALFGAEYDGTTTFRAGTRFGPDAIRAASDGLETYSPEQDRCLTDGLYCDLGNLELKSEQVDEVVEAVYAGVDWIYRNEMTPFMLGGEHSLTSGAVRAVHQRHPDLLVVQFDAHADLRDEYDGEAHNHACAMRRCLDHLDEGDLVQVGIRSGTREEFVELKRTGRLVAPDVDALRRALALHKNRPLYVTVDLDVFDPSVLPGTGTPEPGGIDWPCFAALLSVLRDHKIVAADVMELAPKLDPSGCSDVFAAKVSRELLLMLSSHG